MALDRNDPIDRSSASEGYGVGGQLGRLGDLHDYEIADGEPDPRGWDVRTADGRSVGKVDDLIADTGTMKVRYLDVELDRKGLNLDEDRHVLVPIGRARLDDDGDTVTLNVASGSVLSQLPAYQHGAVDRDYENRLFGGLGATASGGDFYAHEEFDDRDFRGARRPNRADSERYLTLTREEMDVGKRQVKAGEARVRKEVETKRETRTVPTMHEEVEIERRPASSSTPSRTQVSEDEIRVPLMAEEAVVEKRTVPTEEIVVRKHAVRGEQKVEADLREERVVVDRKGDARREDEGRRS
jgi:uncharacterized protein (TIGR02271 family)